MNDVWSPISLGQVLAKSDETIEISPLETYEQITVRMWGKGVESRGHVTGDELGSARWFVAHSQQFIMSKIDARHGAFGLVPERLDGAIVSGDFPLFEVDVSKLLPQYLNWLSKTHSFVDLCKRASEGTTNRVRLKLDRFLATEIPLPPLDEQRRIVAQIDAIAEQVALARGLRHGAVEEAEEIVGAEASSIFARMDISISELSKWTDDNRDGIQTGPFGAMLGRDDFRDEGYPVITIGNVQYGGLRLNGLKFISEVKAQELQRYMAQTGDILFARMGTVGRCCVVPPEADGWIFNYHIIRVAPDHARIDSRYIHWIIRASPDIDSYLQENIRGATREGVNTKIVGRLPCRVPTLDEQRRIVAYLDELQAEVERLKRLQAAVAAELDALLPSVLDRAFRGEL